MANLIRLKQLDQAEISGYVQTISARVVDGSYIVSNYQYFINNFSPSDYYLNLVNSNVQITGTLPSVTDGLRYHIKNLNSGNIYITGLNTIDGLDSFFLLEGESIELLGVNNSTYTGWVSMISNPGL